MFKTETHLHTSEGSLCASVSAAQQAELYKERGYDTIIVTDHFINANTCIDRDLPWEEWVERYCLGYEHAKKRGDEIGLNVLFGIEYGWDGADFLTYGVDKKWMLDNPDLPEIPVYDYCERVHAAGGIIVHAHPFREAGYLRDMKLLPLFTDGVEVINSGNSSKVYNDHALWYAEQFGFFKTAGTDCHHAGGYQFTGVMTEFEIKTIEEYISAVRDKKLSGLILPEEYLPDSYIYNRQ